MKKITQATIATSSAVMLLLGSGGTLAYWHDTVNVGSPTTITAGDLRVAQKAAPTWAIKHSSGKATPVADIAAVRIVPGDQLIYRGEYTITAQGQHLSFRADVDEGSIAAANADEPADVALSKRLAQSTEVTINGAKGPTSMIDHQKNTAGTPYNVKIEATLSWPLDAANTSTKVDNAAKSGAVNLSQFAVHVTQIPKSSQI